MRNVLLVAALDSKGHEVLFLKERIESHGAKTIIIDAGILGGPLFPPDFTREQVSERAGTTLEDVRKISSEGEAMEMQIKGATAIAQELYAKGMVNGILGVGGTMGTALGTAVMRSLPIGIPKVMISTVAALPVVGEYVGTKDIMMFHSVADVAGLNRLTRTIFANAAAAVAGMANMDLDKLENKKLVGISTLGTTEAAARRTRELLGEAGYETITFHTTGVGGRSLEQTVADGVIDGGMIEYSLHEWVDRIAGGLFQPPDDRYENAGLKNLPQVYIPGSTDFIVNTAGAEHLQGRATHMHNRVIMLYRTNRAELKQMGEEVGSKLSKSLSPVTVVIPMRGFSVQDQVGAHLYDPEANLGFIEGIESRIGGSLKVKKVDAHVLEEKFVREVIESFVENAKIIEAVEKSKVG